MSNERILFVEDDESLREILSMNLEDLGFRVDQASCGQEALDFFMQAKQSSQSYSVVISDIKMPNLNGLDLLTHLRQIDERVPVIILTAFGGVEYALEAMRKGAFHYVEKPVNMNALSAEIKRAIKHQTHYSNIDYQEGVSIPAASKTAPVINQLIASSPAMNNVLKIVDKVASSDAPIMILGESGVGKELIAQALHERSHRANKPWVTVNCAAIPGELLESVLFGYEKGSFTGAQKKQEGKFTLANEGTLFLDEIAEMSPALQAKLLRVLQDGLVERVGSIQPEKVDVRIVTATHQDLNLAMEEGRFRRDLYYRLHVVPIVVPPLRQRHEDIPVLLRHFIREFAPHITIQVAQEVDQTCLNYPWPGNIRELRNLVERVLLLREKDCFQLTDLPIEMRSYNQLGSQKNKAIDHSPTIDNKVENLVQIKDLSFYLPTDQLDMRELEKQIILTALRYHEGNQSATARYLNLPRHTLLYRLEKFSIDTNNSF